MSEEILRSQLDEYKRMCKHLKEELEQETAYKKGLTLTKKPNLTANGLHYRLESLQKEILMMDAEPEAGFKQAVQKDKEIIMDAFKDREEYINHLEERINLLKAGIKPQLNLYRIYNTELDRSGANAFAVARTPLEALEKAERYYAKTYGEAEAEGLLHNLKAEKLLSNIQVDQVHVSNIFYW